MEYHTYQPHPDLAALISCYWTLQVPPTDQPQRQRIIPDGTIEMAFILGDDIKRYTNGDEFILQPRAMVLGQTLDPFYIEPVGQVDTFAIRFFPYGFANFVDTPIEELVNKETPLADLFGPETEKALTDRIIPAKDAQERIQIIEAFFLDRLNAATTIDKIVETTLDALFASNGNASIKSILKNDKSQRRQLERKFKQQIGISPKQLGRVIRLQSALKLLLNQEAEKLTQIAYQCEYYDQAHFIKDFKTFTGVNPKDFLDHEHMALSAVFYQ